MTHDETMRIILLGVFNGFLVMFLSWIKRRKDARNARRKGKGTGADGGPDIPR